MKDFINSFYKNHSLIYKVLLFISATFIIVYLFPKSGKFKYNFEKGKPWQSENLYAPFDFAIKKTAKELDEEKEAIKRNSILYFSLDRSIFNDVKDNYTKDFNSFFPDSLSETQTQALLKSGQFLLNASKFPLNLFVFLLQVFSQSAQFIVILLQFCERSHVTS